MTTLLLFAHHADFLGEVRLDHGALERVYLSSLGEERIGPAVKDWQTRGVPVRREVFGTRNHPHQIVFFQERVQPRERGFETALRQWCSDHGIAVVQVNTPVHVECWNLMLRLPLEPAERHVMLIAIAQASADELISWRAFLKDTLAAVEEEEEKANVAIKKLRQKTTSGMAKRFSETVTKSRSRV